MRSELPSGSGRTGNRSGAFADGVRTAIPLALPAIPIGLLIGVTAADSPRIDTAAGAASSLLVFAGSSQLAALDLLDRGAGVVAVVAAVAMINARHLMYSAALSHRYRNAPTWFKWLGSYLLIDQVFAMNAEQTDPELAAAPLERQMWYYLGTAAPMITLWLLATVAGVLVGDVIPASWQIDFAVPVMFGALMVMSIVDRPGVVAAVVGGAVAVIGRSWPSGSGLLAGAVCGIVAAVVADRFVNRVGRLGGVGEPDAVAPMEASDSDGAA